MAEKENFIQSFGALPFIEDVRDYRLKKPAAAVVQEFPETFELQMRSIKNQGNVGSCVAHALAETVEYHNRKQDNIDEAVSVGFIYGNRRNSLSRSSGMYVREALANLVNYGDVFLEDFTENKEVPKIIDLFEERFEKLEKKAFPNRITKYFRVKSDAEIKYALMNYGPVVFAMNWYSDIKVDSTGLISTKQNIKQSEGGHCMVIYGWNEKGWLIQNSWGKSWGKKGCAILPYNIKKNEAWGITDNVSGENRDIKVPFKSKLAKFFAKILNWICNLFRKKK